MKQCITCLSEKELTEFHFRKDNWQYRNQCRQCWSIRCSATRLNISFDEARRHYEQDSCTCCGERLSRRKHLHHTDSGVHGITCHYCNIALRQESSDDLARITACLSYMKSDRKNLINRDNQQERPSYELGILNDHTPDVSSNSRYCKYCKSLLPLSEFYTQRYSGGGLGYYASCKHCYKMLNKAYKYRLSLSEVERIRSSRHCECCGKTCDVFIHHVGDHVYGGVCHDCNILLQQEDDSIKHKLRCCESWILSRR